jgi:hypothetical protein
MLRGAGKHGNFYGGDNVKVTYVAWNILEFYFSITEDLLS